MKSDLINDSESKVLSLNYGDEQRKLMGDLI